MGRGYAPLPQGLAEAHRPAAVFRRGSSRAGLTVGAGQQGWELAAGLVLGLRTPWHGCAVHGLLIALASLVAGAQALGAWASVIALGLSSCGAWA